MTHANVSAPATNLTHMLRYTQIELDLTFTIAS